MVIVEIMWISFKQHFIFRKEWFKCEGMKRDQFLAEIQVIISGHVKNGLSWAV